MNMHINQLSQGTLPLSGSRPMTIWVSSENVVMHTLPKPTAPKRKWPELIPWLLEDRLLQNVTEIHLVHIEQNSDNLELIAVSKNTMNNWLQALKDAQISPSSLIPDYLALPWSENSISVIQRDNVLLVRTGLYSGFAANSTIAFSLIESVVAESEDSPSLSIIKSAELTLEQFPKALRAKVVTQNIEVDWRLAKPALAANLLVGEFQQKKPAGSTRKWWAMAALLFISFAFYFVLLKPDNTKIKNSGLTGPQSTQSTSSPSASRQSNASNNGQELINNSQSVTPQAQQPKPKVNAVLLGILIDSESASATLQVNGQAEKVFHIGDELENGQEIIDISATEVTVEEYGQSVHLSLKKHETLLQQQDSSQVISSTDNHAGFAMANMFAAVPVQVENYNAGLKLDGLSEEMKMLADIQEGDVVVQVGDNGIQALMSDPSIWASYTTQTELAVTVIRDEKEIILYVNAFSLSAQILPNIAREMIQ